MTPTVVLIPNHGLVQGIYDEEKHVRRFLNIPFATVHKRWHRASPVASWTGIRDATQYGPLCPQTLDPCPQPSQMFSDMFGLPTRAGPELVYSERDCLNMAIYAPNIPAPSGGFPTVVYLHGGSFKKGGNALPAQDFTNFVQTSVSVGKPVVVAAINYRLDHLGFLGSRELALEYDLDPTNALTHDQEEAFGYWGLHDQKLAFEWIRDHIHVFGGRGTDLTAMGHSSGSTSLMYQTMIPSHHGLFTRLIAHSSPTGSMTTFATPLYGQKVVDGLSRHFKVHTHNGEVQEQVISSTTSRRLPAQAQKALSTVQVLRSIPAEHLVNVDLPVGNLTTPVQAIASSRPSWENSSLFQRHSLQLIRDPSRLDPGVRAVYIGTTMDETSGFVSQMGAATLAGFWPALDRLVDPTLHRRLLEVYGTPTTDAEAKRIAGEYMRDLEFWSPASAVLQTLMHSQDRRVHRFYLESKVECVERARGLGLGAFHCIDVNHSIMSDVALGYMSEQERAFGWKMVGKWIDVAWGEDTFSPRESPIHWTTSDPVLVSSSSSPLSSALVSPVVLASSHGVLGEDKTWQRRDGQVELRITKQYKFKTASFEQMQRDKLELMGRNAEWVVRHHHQAPSKIVSVVGVPQRQVQNVRVYRARL